MLTYAFINSWLDCWNVLYCCVAEGLLGRLQSVPNAAARLVTGLERRTHSNTCSATGPLAADSSTCDVQSDDVGPPLACRNCTGLPVRRVSPHFICCSALSAFSWLPDMCTSSDTQWSLFYRCLVLVCGTDCHCSFSNQTFRSTVLILYCRRFLF